MRRRRRRQRRRRLCSPPCGEGRTTGKCSIWSVVDRHQLASSLRSVVGGRRLDSFAELGLGRVDAGDAVAVGCAKGVTGKRSVAVVVIAEVMGAHDAVEVGEEEEEEEEKEVVVALAGVQQQEEEEDDDDDEKEFEDRG